MPRVTKTTLITVVNPGGVGEDWTTRKAEKGAFLLSNPESGRSTGEGIGYPLQFSWASLVAQL